MSELSSQLTDVKTRLAGQEAEIKSADSKLQVSLSEMEKLKAGFTAEKKTWAEEKTLLTQRAENAEAALEEVTTELTGLKNRVSQMVSAIFGKPYVLNFLPSFDLNCKPLADPSCSKHMQALEARI